MTASTPKTTIIGTIKSKTALLPPTTRYVVVFDIDWTLCFYGERNQDKRNYGPYATKYGELPLIWWRNEENGNRYQHTFLLHLQILFDYLIQRAVRVVFFSSACKERNLSVIPDLLKLFWGEEEYEALKSRGQFMIYSFDDMRTGEFSGECMYM